MPTPIKYDVSIIVSVHNDAKYLARTIWSFSDAATFAAQDGITTELVIVQDNPHSSIPHALEQCDFSAFANVQIITVSVGSLGPCRQAGIDVAEGKYVALSDADDLISYNMIADMYRHAEKHQGKVVLFPDWLVAFGGQHHLYKMYSLEEVNELALFDHHPFISRSFLARQHAQEIRLANVPINGPYAYEDWHHNTSLAAKGFELIVCPNTVFFYRKKGVSMLNTVNSSSSKVIPFSEYFSPENYIDLCKYGHRKYKETEKNGGSSAEALYSAFISSIFLLELCSAANFIDPAIDIRHIKPSNTFSNRKHDLTAGDAYFQICNLLRGKQFTDVFILPFFTMGGAEKVILDIIENLLAIDPAKEVLFVFGMKLSEHQWLDRLPEQVTTCDIAHFCGPAAEETVDLVTLRTIQAFAPSAHIYIKSSPYGYRFWGRYGKLLSHHKSILFRFCDGSFEMHSLPFVVGFDFNFISEYGETLSLVLSDNKYINDADRARLPYLAGKQDVLYSVANEASNGEELDSRFEELHDRIIWASRFDPQKRPELLPLLAIALESEFPSVTLEVWGTAVLGTGDISQLQAHSNVEIMGTFSSFADINYQRSDLFLYTSRFDGIPTVLLSALGAGMPVVAPRLGGIPEIVIDGETGLLVDPHLSDEALILAYIEAIRKIRSSASIRSSMGRAALKLIKEQHSPQRYLDVIKRNLFA